MYYFRRKTKMLIELPLREGLSVSFIFFFHIYIFYFPNFLQKAYFILELKVNINISKEVANIFKDF